MPMLSLDEENPVVLVTGPSGAGRLTAIRGLEDLGYEAIDNLPLPLLRQLFTLPQSSNQPLAIGLDVRTRGFSVRSFIEALAWMRRTGWLSPTLLYLGCTPEVLMRRYSESRRPHPMAQDETVEESIRRERETLAPLLERADLTIDTSSLSPHDLKARLRNDFAAAGDEGLSVIVESFSYKRGVPAGLDMALDCRFLRNPHWDAALRPQDGRDEGVAEYIGADPRHDAFMTKTLDMLLFLLPAYKAEGKAYFTVGFGCTGGRHRSVYMSQAIAKRLEQAGWRVSIRHRQLEQASTSMPATG